MSVCAISPRVRARAIQDELRRQHVRVHESKRVEFLRDRLGEC